MSQASPAPQEQDRYPYSAIVDRKPLRWPDGARVAVWVIPNIEHFLFDRPSTSVTPVTTSLVPDVLNYSWRDYGVRIGIWRMMEVMEKHGVRKIEPMGQKFFELQQRRLCGRVRLQRAIPDWT